MFFLIILTISVNGNMGNQMDKEGLFTMTKLCFLGLGSVINYTEKDSAQSQMERAMKVTGLSIYSTELVLKNGQTNLSTRENLERV